MPLALIVHGGAWDIPDDEVAPHLAGCRRALAAGWEALTNGRSALDAVEIAVRIMEDDPTFDAGVGSVLNRDGLVELDAAIMDGATLRSGAVAAVRGIRNPISLARRVLESEAALLVGRGAERFADTVGIERCADEDMIVPRERARWEELCRLAAYRTPDAFQRPPGEVAGLRGIVAGGDHAPDHPGLRIQHPGDTVGAVALDRYGNLAAAVSTGGTPFKLPGRVGDTPLIGAGLYADVQTGGCASTGWGESIIITGEDRHRFPGRRVRARRGGARCNRTARTTCPWIRGRHPDRRARSGRICVQYAADGVCVSCRRSRRSRRSMNDEQ